MSPLRCGASPAGSPASPADLPVALSRRMAQERNPLLQNVDDVARALEVGLFRRGVGSLLRHCGLRLPDAPYDFVGPCPLGGAGSDAGGWDFFGGAGSDAGGWDFSGDGDDAEVLGNLAYQACSALVDRSMLQEYTPTEYSKCITLAMQRTRGNRGIVLVGFMGNDVVFVMQDFYFYEDPTKADGRLSQAGAVQMVLVQPEHWGGDSDVFCNCVLPVHLIRKLAQGASSKLLARTALQIAAGGEAGAKCPHPAAFIAAVAHAVGHAHAVNLADRLVRISETALGFCVYIIEVEKVITVAVYRGIYRCLSCRSQACKHVGAASVGQPAIPGGGLGGFDPKGLLTEHPGATIYI